ncbi:di-trans,poly-cis-decaprenylcistransferase [Candidatus Gracilibacteria bacterium CG2_30_37_12]|nr:MAG: di-trans,poly-cis-decaprenylcistransferase [Candidatus Gracilibacteria bacterium CG2_30_37_12]
MRQNRKTEIIYFLIFSLVHLGFIMDGNRRWAKQHMIQTLLGHQEGRIRLEEMVELCYNEKIEYCSFWALAKKNIENRSTEELTYLYDLLVKSIQSLLPKLLEKSIKFEWVGNSDILPPHIVKVLNDATKEAENGTKMTLILAIGYGGQDEIIRGMKNFIKNGGDINSLDETTFLPFLDTGRFPPPDLIVRTGGDTRHSGYFLYTSEYSEYYFTDTLWPDFKEREFYKALETLKGARRMFGK